MNERPDRRFGALAVLAGIVAALHGLVYVPFAGHVLGDTPTYTGPAHALLDGSYSTPLPLVDVTGLPIPENAHGALERQTYRVPGYPLMLAAAGGGTSTSSIDAVIGIQAALAGATALLLAFVLRRVWTPGTALLGAYLVALDPFPKHYVTRVLTEVLTGFLVVVAAYAFVRAWQSRSALWWAAVGAAVAALTLTRPLFVLAVPLALVACVVRRRAARRRVASALAFVAASAVLLGPWLAWTSDVAGRPVLQSFGEGWNLLIAAHGEGLGRTSVEIEASAGYRRDFASVHRLAPTADRLSHDPEAHPHYLVRADAEQRRIARHLYLERLRDEPARLVGEIAYRAYFLWMAHEDWVQPARLLPFLRAVDWTALLLAALGVAIALRNGGPMRAIAVFVVLFTLVNAVHHVEARYAMPMRSFYVPFAALALATALGAWRRRGAALVRLPGEGREQEASDPDARARHVADRGQVRLRQPEREPRRDG